MNEKDYSRPFLQGKDVLPKEQELLVRLMEEASEVIQSASKILRWGWLSYNPELPIADRKFNVDALESEINDFKQIVFQLHSHPRGRPDPSQAVLPL